MLVPLTITLTLINDIMEICLTCFIGLSDIVSYVWVFQLNKSLKLILMTCKISVNWIFRKSHNSVGRRPFFQGLGICWWILKWGQNNQFEEESYELWERKQGKKKTLFNNISRRWWANTKYDQKYSVLFFLLFFFFHFFTFPPLKHLIAMVENDLHC